MSDFIITKDQLCGRLMRVAVEEIEIVGYPVQISSHDYMRNAFNFNICFIVKKGSSSQYESMVKKVAMTFESLERQNGFLQSPNILVCASFQCFCRLRCETSSLKSTKGSVKKTAVTFGSTPPRASFSSPSTPTPLSQTLPTSFSLSLSALPCSPKTTRFPIFCFPSNRF